MPEVTAELDDLAQVAALGYLLNALSHDLNNQLTNLMLGADQLQYGGGKEVVDLILDQVRKLTEMTRSVQKLGQRNLQRTGGPSDLSVIAGDAVSLLEAIRGPGACVVEQQGAQPVGIARRLGVHALLLLDRAGRASFPAGTTTVSVGREDVPRSAWAAAGDTVSMAALRLRRGEPDGDAADLKRIVDAFFAHERADDEVAVMAAWEIVRKARARMAIRRSARGWEAILHLPLVDPA